ncbi:hypothetical protein ACFL2V_05980, partial [Pseudomonadota bacterium]
MSKGYKAASSIGAAALVLSGAAIAVVDQTAMDDWSVTNGTISANCAFDGGTGCGGELVDKGFYQRMIQDGGVTYFQTIITEDNATASSGNLDSLLFSDESFVRTGNVSGILDKQRISESVLNNGSTSTYTDFRASTQLGAGWAGDSLTLTQYLYDEQDDFQTDFIFKQEGPSGTPNAKGMKITAYVPIENGDDQDFVLVDLQGDYVTAAVSDVNLVGDNNPGTMSWTNDTSDGDNTGSVGDRIQAIWVGQTKHRDVIICSRG